MRYGIPHAIAVERGICGAQRKNESEPCEEPREGCEKHCGCKKKSDGGVCAQRPMLNGRCRMHSGGAAAGAGSPRFKDGKYSKYAAVFTGDALEHYERAADDPRVIELTDELTVLEVLIMEELKMARTGEGGVLWEEMKIVWDTFQRAQPSKDTTTAGRCLRRMGEIIEEGAGRHASQEVALNIIERKRKVSETERRRRTDEQTSITEVSAMAFVASLIAVVKESITDICSDAVGGRIEVEEIERKLNARIGSGVTRLVHQDVSASRGSVPNTF